MSINVLLADDHPVVRDGLRFVIEKKGHDIKILEAADGRQVLKLAAKKHIDVYILDISMPNLNGIETTKRLLKINANSKIIILSIHDGRTFVERALEAGAKGYMVKSSASEDIVEAIRQVQAGRYYLSPAISGYIMDRFMSRQSSSNQQSEIVKLTTREKEILQLIGEGSSNKEIAAQLYISVNTVHVHRNNIMQKLNIHNQTDLVRLAIKEGLANP